MNSEFNNQVKPWLVQQAVNLLMRSKAVFRKRQLKSIPASLLVDSFSEWPLPGVRSAVSVTRQLIYEAGPYHICFSIDRLNPTQAMMNVWREFQNPKANCSIEYLKPTEGTSILGQWMLMSDALTKGDEADIELLKEAEVVYTTKSDEFGAFSLEGISEGIYDLRIRLKGEELEIMGLNAVAGPH